MSSLLDETAACDIEARVAQVEAHTGVQVVCAVHARSDSYPEAPWRAFALGVVLAALALALLDLWRPAWTTSYALLIELASVMGAGITAAVLTLVLPGWAHLFIGIGRRELEVKERAKALFVEQGIASTPARTAVLVFVSVFERRVEIVADRGFEGAIGTREWEGVAAAMAGQVRPAAALAAGLAALEALLMGKGYRGGATADELPNRPLQAGKP